MQQHLKDELLQLVIRQRRVSLLRRLHAQRHLSDFIKIYLPHHFPLPYCRFHHEIIDDLSSEQTNKRIVRIAPRGHGKTTICAMAYPLWCLATGRKRFVLILGSNQTLANDKIRDCMAELETNDKLMKDYTYLEPGRDRKNQYIKYTDSQIVFDNGSVLLGKGMGAAIRGIKHNQQRPDLIIIDDPEKDTDLESPPRRERNKKYFDSVVNHLGGVGTDVDIIAIDTLKHYDSLIQYIYDKPGWNSGKYDAVDDEVDRRALWESAYCYHVDDLTKREKANWERRGTEKYKDIRMPFYGQYYKHESDETPYIIGLAEDNPETFNQEFRGIPMQLDEMPLRRELWELYEYHDGLIDAMQLRIGALDLSMGKSHGDFQAIAIMGLHAGDNGRGVEYYLLDGSLTKFDIVNKGDSGLVDLICTYVRLYRLKAFIIEDNGAQALFLNTLRNRFIEQDIRCQIFGKTSRGNKEERINGNLGLLMQRGSVKIRHDYTKAYRGFMQQFEHYPKGAHDDAPDVTNMALMELTRAWANKSGRF